LCGEAEPWQVLSSQRVFYAAEPVPLGVEVGALELKGFSRPIRVFCVDSVNESREELE
jgi:class 3 adenylate cyclase